MSDNNLHRAAASNWAEHAAGLPPERALQNFEEAFSALWRRAHRTLGDVTLMAIVDRVLYNAAEQFPLIASIKIEEGGLHCEALRARASELDAARLVEALRFVLADFLTVLGNLVAEVLTPALHAELTKVTMEQANGAGITANLEAQTKQDEEPKS